jgi:hypothetical protein
MHRHGVGLSAEAILLTTVAVSQRVPTMTVTAAGVVVVRATEQRTPTASRTQDNMTEFTIIAASGSRRRVLAPVRGYPTSEGSRPSPPISASVAAAYRKNCLGVALRPN